jgi:hypothetical protein
MPPNLEQLPVQWVSKEIIRQEFNSRQLAEKAASGELIKKLKRDSHPATPPPNEPICTHSQIVYYYTEAGSPLAIVHQYLRPDGTIGGSGLPDPKRLFLPDRIISIRTVFEK